MHKTNIKNIFYLTHIDKNIFIYIQILSFVFFFPILYGAGYYADDVSRATSGSYYWDKLGRYLAFYIAKLYSSGDNLVIDPMPFGCIFNIFIIGCSSYFIYLKFKEKYNTSAFVIACLFIVNPFLVENLLYRYDSMGMVLALFFVVLAFSLKNERPALIIKIISLLVSLNFYQTFSNLYIGLVAIELLLFVEKHKNYRKLLHFILLNIIVFLLANIIYFIELKILGTNLRGEILPINYNTLYLAYKNSLAAFRPFITFWSFSPNFIFILLPFLALSLIKEAIKQHYMTLVGILISSVLILFSGIGFMSILKTQFLAPRGLSYFPIILMASVIIIRLSNKYTMWVMCIPIFTCVIFVSRVGNMQSIQNKFEQPILFSVSKDVYNLTSKGVITFYSKGMIPLSSYIHNIRKSTPFNGYMYRSSWITTGRIHEYGNKNIKLEWSSMESSNIFDPKKNGMALSVNNSPFYKIYTDGDKGWIIWEG